MKVKSPFLIYFIEILLLELITRYLLFSNILSTNLLYVIAFTLPFALIATLITKIFPKIINRILSIIICFGITIYFEFQYVFSKLFSVVFSFNTLSLAEQAFDFFDVIKDAIISNGPQIVILLIPFFISIILNILTDFKRCDRYQIASYIIILIGILFIDSWYLLDHKKEYNSPYKLFFEVDDQMAIIDRFGLLTYTTIDVKRATFGFELKNVDLQVDEVVNEPVKGPIVYGKNELNIDFDKLIENTSNSNLIKMHEYFRDSEGSYKNEYTGMFKGKNLIFLVAEGFNEIAVDENRTPTLYKLIHEGFNFTNFYSPVFLSTTGGEFQAVTGLVPTQEILKTWKYDTPDLLYALGNSFGDLGYTTNAYHDWTYTYYKRHVTMETLGYDNYMGCNNGLEKLQSCEWLPSDTKMMEVTAPLYMNEEHFVTYYVTVSGHCPYARGANIINKHYDTVKDLKLPDNTKNYLASQVELDRALEELIHQLTITNHLDDTVIALVGDHYPYTLSLDEINAASSYKRDSVVEVNHSNFILWSNDMEPTTITKTGSQIDVLPTLLNLFGIDYDSRLIVGKDILSTYEGLAIFSNRSWVTDKGTYFANQRKFVPKDGVEVESGYVDRINKRVSNAFVMSKLLLDNNYYVKVKE